ncbi:hypothetical protein AAFF_G00250190 [Aldrovandia affinis]|uniref:Ig-like domain-containing protein n=1 Tax=Aldrovandia affinis TaxID=143900 RepID=A0AAD7RCV6_9TELE|nr:hypothetical protein AAFF_G00250190 [Aldrovandia affinis]
MEFDGDELLYVNPYNFKVAQRLPEFAQQWRPDPGLPSTVYEAVDTCKYNIPNCIVGEQYPPEVIEPPTSLVYAQREVEMGVPNTLICFVTDFHPTPVNVSWSKGEEPVREGVSETQYYSNDDFSFCLFSYLSFTPQEGDMYSCSVEHRGLEQPLTRLWEVGMQTDPEAAETVVCVGGLTVGMLGVASGIFLIIKANKHS